MDLSASAGLYSWYQKVKTKDLGETRVDWLQHLREQARQNSSPADNEKIIPLQKENVKSDNQEQEKEDGMNETKLTNNSEPNSTSSPSHCTVSSNRVDCESLCLSLKMEKTAEGKAQHLYETLAEQNKDYYTEERRREMNKEDVNTRARMSKDVNTRARVNNIEGVVVGKSTVLNKDPIEERCPKMTTSPLPLVTVIPQHQQPTTPFSMFLNRSSSTKGCGNVLVEDSHSSSPYSPTVPITDILSPGTRCNTTHEVIPSLGTDDSIVSWSSGLATPTITKPGQHTHNISPSTIERLTLHPRQGLAHNVLARSLFSPHTAGAHNNNQSPGLGIIHCYSPVHGFTHKTRNLKSRTSSQDDSGGSGPKVVCLQNITQGFGVDSGGTSRSDHINETGKISSQDGQISRTVTPHENAGDEKAAAGRLEIKRCSSPNIRLIDLPASTSTPISVHIKRTSLPVRHLAFHSNLQDSLVNEKMRENFNERVLETAQLWEEGKREEEFNSISSDIKETESVMDNVNVIQGDSYCKTETNSSQNSTLFGDAFDLICSPVISTRKEEMWRNVKKNHRDPFDKGRNHQQDVKDYREQKPMENSEYSLNMSVSIDAIKYPKFETVSDGTSVVGDVEFSRCDVCGKCLPSESKENETLQIIPLKKMKNIQAHQNSLWNENIDDRTRGNGKESYMNRKSSVDVIEKEKFCQCSKNNRSNLFGRQDAATTKSSSPVASKVCEDRKRKSDSLLEKLSLRKKRRHCGTFLYPTSTERVCFENLEVSYRETLFEDEEGGSSKVREEEVLLDRPSANYRETLFDEDGGKRNRTTTTTKNNNKASVVVNPSAHTDKTEVTTNQATHFQAIAKQHHGNFLSLSNLKKDAYFSPDKETYELPVSPKSLKKDDRIEINQCFSNYQENIIRSTENESIKHKIRQDYNDENKYDLDENDAKSKLTPQNKERLKCSVSTDSMLVAKQEGSKAALMESSSGEQLKKLSKSQTQKRGYSQFLDDSLSNIDFSTMDVLDVNNDRENIDDDNNDSDQESTSIFQSGYASTNIGMHERETVSQDKFPIVNKNYTLENSNFGGFVTGNGKEMHVNMKSLCYAKKLFEELPHDKVEETCQTEAKLKNSLDHCTESSSPKESQGSSDFNRLIKPKISESGMTLCLPNICTKNTKRKRLNIDPLPNSNNDKSVILLNGNSLGNTNNIQTSSGSIGFLTARGEKVPVKESALLKAKKLWEESSSSVVECLKENKQNHFPENCYSTCKEIRSNVYTKDSAKFNEKKNLFPVTNPKPVESPKNCMNFDDNSMQGFPAHNKGQECKGTESDAYGEIRSISKNNKPEEGTLQKFCDVDYIMEGEGGFSSFSTACEKREIVRKAAIIDAKKKVLSAELPRNDDANTVPDYSLEQSEYTINLVNKSQGSHCKDGHKINEGDRLLHEEDTTKDTMARKKLLSQNTTSQRSSTSSGTATNSTTMKQNKIKLNKAFDESSSSSSSSSSSVVDGQTGLPQVTLNRMKDPTVTVSSPSSGLLSVVCSKKKGVFADHDLRTNLARNETSELLSEVTVSRESVVATTKTSSPSITPGFLTARGGKVILEEASILRAKRLFEEISHQDNISSSRKSFHDASPKAHENCQVEEEGKNEIQTDPIITESVLLKDSCSNDKSPTFKIMHKKNCYSDQQGNNSVDNSNSTPTSKSTQPDSSSSSKDKCPNNEDNEVSRSPSPVLGSQLKKKAMSKEVLSKKVMSKGVMSISQSEVQSHLQNPSCDQTSFISVSPICKIVRPIDNDVEVYSRQIDTNVGDTYCITSYTNKTDERLQSNSVVEFPTSGLSVNTDDDNSMTHIWSPKYNRAELKKRHRSHLLKDSSQLSKQAENQSTRDASISPLQSQETVQTIKHKRSPVLSKHSETNKSIRNVQCTGIVNTSTIREKVTDTTRSPVLSKHSETNRSIRNDQWDGIINTPTIGDNVTRSIILSKQQSVNRNNPSGCQKIFLKESNTEEVSDITEITEAFLKDDDDDSWEQQETTTEPTTTTAAAHRKRLREETQEEENVEGEEVITPNNTTTTKLHKTHMTDTNHIPTSGYSKECLQDEISTSRELLRKKQTKEIEHKEKHERQSVMGQVIEGTLYKTRKEHKGQRVKLQSLGKLQVWPGVGKDVLAVQPNNSLQYRFPVKDKGCDVVRCSDGCSVVVGADGCVGVGEVETAFLASPGVHPPLIHPSWVKNHYRWIVWKLAAMERHLLHCPMLTLENLVLRLKYRYDREIDRAQRPVLRRVIEHDDSPHKTMVLCVADIKRLGCGVRVKGSTRGSEGHNNTILELTDGWYSIGGVVDGAMNRMVESGMVTLGTKLVIHGAQLTGSSSHQPCHPLEAPDSLLLRLHTNLTRRARWWTRLGLLPQRGPPHTLLAPVLDDGGLVGQLTVLLARVYPMVYFERGVAGGKATFRAERDHRKTLKETQKQREMTINQIVADVEKEFSQEEKESRDKKRKLLVATKEEISKLTLGEDITHLMEETDDPTHLQGLLTTEQIQLARTWQERQAEERRQTITKEIQHRQAKKQILYEATPLLKVRVVDKDHSSAMVVIWRPTDDLVEALTEGSFYTVQYLMTGGYRMGCQQLTATRQTKWKHHLPPSFQYDCSRSALPLCLTSSAELSPLWQEVDLVGVVLRIEQSDNVASVMVYIIDHHTNILALKLWKSFKESGYEDIMVVGRVISVMNGSWRGHKGGRFGCVHVTELTVISACPRTSHLIEAVTHLNNSVQDMKSLLHEGDMKLDRQFDERVYSKINIALPTVNEKTTANHQTECTKKECTEYHTNKNSIIDTSHHSGKRIASCDETRSCELNTIQSNSKSLMMTSGEAEKSSSCELDPPPSSPDDAGTVVDNEAGKNVSSDPSIKRVEQRSRETRHKLHALGQYSTPSPVRNLQSPATVNARRPFRAPYKHQ
ncbi:hypothetical protein Pcinc_024856 [Petrolisthes cinctipes]|uniref:Uncharacterized protein n=1 Tax=Petrolisthes cinctipes TaxID=88211 RepID=A0AAE1FB89_PETCI|nr:hypothetical protein Pcinc_024856 [Petrolisthes cinctipes]